MAGSTQAERTEERSVWEGRPSQILLAHVHLGCALLALALLWGALELALPLPAAVGLAIAPLVYALARGILSASRSYRVTTERLVTRSGIFSKRTEETELYRVTDYQVVEPFLLRLFGLGHVELATSDEANPLQRLEGIRAPQALRDELRKHVEVCRDKKRVRVTELE